MVWNSISILIAFFSFRRYAGSLEIGYTEIIEDLCVRKHSGHGICRRYVAAHEIGRRRFSLAIGSGSKIERIELRDLRIFTVTVELKWCNLRRFRVDNCREIYDLFIVHVRCFLDQVNTFTQLRFQAFNFDLRGMQCILQLVDLIVTIPTHTSKGRTLFESEFT